MTTALWLRPPIVAGRFYPREKAKVLASLEEFYGDPKPEPALAIMAPHAGYIYSGKYAGDVYRRTSIPENVIVLCPNHTGRGPQISIWSEGAWETPLGRIQINEELAKILMQKLKVRDGDMLAHLSEHAIEVHLPFLQYQRPDVKIIPIVLGGVRLEKCLEVGKVLAEVVREFGNTLLIASSDMSHYISAEEALKLDSLALSKVKAVDPSGLFETVCENDISMCGFIPTTAVLESVKQLGGSCSDLISYGHSGEVTGDLKSVVGYANALFK